MRKLSTILVAAAVIFSPLLAGVPVSARAVCEIGYTGPDSNNLCTSVTKYACEVDNKNTVKIKNTNDQVVASGTVSTSGNTETEDSTSGTVTNTNGATFSVIIKNTTGVPGTCTAAAVVAATEKPETPTAPLVAPTANVQPTNGGGGAAGGGAGRVTALPVTSGGSSLMTLAVVAGILGLISALSVGSVLFYRYRKSI